MSTHTEHATAIDARWENCLEGECDHVDEEGQPEDMSACPVVALEVCVDCMDERGHGRDPGAWDDVALVEWPHPETHLFEEWADRG